MGILDHPFSSVSLPLFPILFWIRSYFPQIHTIFWIIFPSPWFLFSLPLSPPKPTQTCMYVHICSVFPQILKWFLAKKKIKARKTLMIFAKHLVLNLWRKNYRLLLFMPSTYRINEGDFHVKSRIRRPRKGEIHVFSSHSRSFVKVQAKWVKVATRLFNKR